MKVTARLASAARALARHRLRAVSSALGVTCGVGTLVTMLAVGTGAREELMTQLAELGTHTLLLRGSSAGADTDAPESLVPTDVDALARLCQRVHGLRDVAPLVDLALDFTEVPAELVPAVVGTTAAYFRIRGLAPRQGRPLVEHDEATQALVCVLGAEVAQALGSAGRVGAVLTTGDRAIEVVGVLEPRVTRASGRSPIATRDLDRCILVPRSSAGDLGATGLERAVHEATLRFDDGHDVGAAAARIRWWAQRDAAFEVIVPAELLAQARGTQRILGFVLGAVALVSLLVGGIGIMNVTLVSVTERTYEIGLRRAVGASRADIGWQFLVEAVVLTTSGAAAGVGLGALGAAFVSRAAGWPTIVSGASVGMALAMAATVGLGSGLYPAIRAARVDPATALRTG